MNVCVVAAVYDGYLLKKSLRWSPVGGRLLTECMRKSIDPEGTVLRPRYEVKKTHLGQGNFSVRTQHCEKLFLDLILDADIEFELSINACKLQAVLCGHDCN